MEAVIDSGGRILLPKQLRTALGLVAGSTVDISWYGAGIQITPGGRTAQVVRDDDGRLVVRAVTEVTDDAIFALIDAGRR
jgi:AbrB family looped-hinge helix DNA binding protein